ncbi:hypothetical protein Fraau_0021 [Frateuria aurantia DSM 6220]|uniref:Uncharacterized protein n=1 Tax=Frateuria aurantia (strain ATCC 33424 / DSM 6220 / KCTC 2777 / LMG 1558 / NBRC 3245 / NCIMB 13370) TaxID=767434 RepID=H8KZ41_FRAAD|nr:hypothetical protein Fraau_0021 [Frateuria aurantia DSM 6220]
MIEPGYQPMHPLSSDTPAMMAASDQADGFAARVRLGVDSAALLAEA